MLINEAYKAANPGNAELAKWLDAQLATFDKIYGSKRPCYINLQPVEGRDHTLVQPVSAFPAPDSGIKPAART
ncbi:MAG: hypothetical protein KIT13_10840 [Burkholderiales bacterium]|nr:hypothetical protein [Burkholderiales bacterium]MCW5603724.1 hypothetical protein [Burkholderiales bacterium]